MAVFPYVRRPSIDPSFPYIDRPEIQVTIRHGSRAISRLLGHIDSGADAILVNKEWAKQLGIEWKDGARTAMLGIAGSGVVYLHGGLELAVEAIPDSARKVRIAFIDSPSVSVLLGQEGFFDNFRVDFQKYNGLFELTPMP